MQGKFSPEIQLVNNFRIALIKRQWTIIQLVCSGGQVHFSITYKVNGVNKTVFPDLVAYKDKHILIGEIKELFDQNDHDKLIEISESQLAKSRVIKNISIRTNTPSNDFTLGFVLINKDINSNQISKIDQIIFSEGDFFLKKGDCLFEELLLF